ncbi:FAD-dependent oxidoreductase [Streptomyces erythrochromogenes]|uniref:FAD-dependent oxidoreductase n=1 Tax=Streptomyces erythrochromogenes TaxID=285574 RepID=UPI00225862F5|nr:FAD-dependent oxidoreductase [Streptomyces erythrochromogenes]MCX5585715.1 FAD-dependent oxidoreductase [Streptomyces erythrochromogenes]
MPARVTVVGGGVTALLTAVERVLDGHRVTVVDQGSGAHGRAGSAGRPRILRALHPADPAATGAALRAHHRWAALEELLLTRFYEQVGALTVLPPAAADGAALVEYAGGTARELTAAGLSHTATRTCTWPGTSARYWRRRASCSPNGSSPPAPAG